MATVTFRGATWTTAAGNKTVVATPAAGDLIVVFCASSGRTTAQPPTVSSTVQGAVFTRHGTAFTKNTSADSGWLFIAESLVYSATSTTWTMTQSSDSGGGLVVFSVSGMSIGGLAAILQVGKQDNAAAGTPSITMGQAILTGNPVLGFVNNTTNSSTTTAPPTSWTEDADQGYTTPPNGIEATHRSSGETLTTIAWTGASASAFGSMLVELDASVPTDTIRDNFDRTVGAGGWGTADVGGAWTADPGDDPTKFSVDGAAGKLAHQTGGGSYGMWMSQMRADSDDTIQVSTDKLAAGSDQTIYWYARYQGSNNWYRLIMVFVTTQAIDCYIQKDVATVQTTIAGVVHVTRETHAANRVFNIRLNVVSTTLRAKIWQQGTVEPDAWDITGTDSSITTAGQLFFRFYLGATPSNAPVTYTVDNLNQPFIHYVNPMPPLIAQ